MPPVSWERNFINPFHLDAHDLTKATQQRHLLDAVLLHELVGALFRRQRKVEVVERVLADLRPQGVRGQGVPG